jgi:cardiolipin synthase
MRHSIFLLSAAASLFATSCSSLTTIAQGSREQRPQANDPLTGVGLLGLGFARGTALSAVRQPITTVTLGLAVLWHRPREVVSANMPVSIALAPVPVTKPGSADFEKHLDELNIPTPQPGKLTWLVDGKHFFPEFDREMAKARRSVDLQVYIFDNDDIAVRYADRLKKRANDVSVRIMFDSLGSTFAHTSAPEKLAPRGFVPPPMISQYLQQDSKIRLRRTLNPWLVSDHSKLIVIDRKIGYVGGMNVGREYFSEWHDLMIRVDGPIVASLQRDFNRTWRKAGPGGDLALFRKPATTRKVAAIAGEVPVRLLRTDPAEFRYEILKSNLLAIRAAKKRIWIENPYVAHDDITLALEEAARRGVDVRVVIPARGDSTIMDIGNIAVARRLIQAGGKVYNYPRMTHMKVMICDGWATVGSANLDTLSMRINREINLAFNDPATVDSLVNSVFLPDFRASKRRRLSDTTSPIAPIAEAIADQL